MYDSNCGVMRQSTESICSSLLFSHKFTLIKTKTESKTHPIEAEYNYYVITHNNCIPIKENLSATKKKKKKIKITIKIIFPRFGIREMKQKQKQQQKQT